MPSPSDPIQVWERRQRSIIAVGAILALGVSGWAIWPPRPATTVGGVDPATLIAPKSEPDVDRAVTPTNSTMSAPGFASVRLWNPPPPAPPLTQQAEKPEDARSPKLQLIGIIQQGGDGALHAAIYDIDEDRLLILRSGERIGKFTITTIDDKAVELTDGRRTTRLALQPEVPSI